MQEQIDMNYKRIKIEVNQIILDEFERINNDPQLTHLIPKDK
ncbi:hypothetical protein M2451_003972 [Dysgonomonas sp. PFB1-18]|nr:hypothetical protein [Dysgonomonas sp. PF1-14]MDH6340968.1 hypothetical protein [Dysgonomonas sp. PF1-16]MDH6382627.1 hypothetical protein [Dysgonomonas sp. PFB1-18]MDH6399974.1 hypothetical protein [Dysgonomonas sp. PF1-23]